MSGRSLFSLTGVFVFVLFSVLLLSFTGCEEKYGHNDNEEEEEQTVVPDEDAGDAVHDADREEERDEAGDEAGDDDYEEISEEEPGIVDEDETPDEEPEIPEEEKIKSVTIGTYNTRLFFDKVCDTGTCSSSDFEKVPSDPEYSEKVSDLAASVREIGADIILVQEVEKDSCLKDLFEKAGGYDEYYLGEKGYSASVDTGVMTKGKITYKNKHIEQIDCAGCDCGKTTFSRAFLETHISLGGRDIIVFSAHFKSKADDDAERRLAEAAAAAKIMKSVAEKYPGALIVMGGDLNDEPGSDTLEPFESDPAFLRVADELSSRDQATYSYRGEAIAIDHIFWMKSGAGSYRQGSAEVVKDAPSWYSLGSSDHAALKAVFEF